MYYFAIVTQKGEELAYSLTTYPDAESRQEGINLVKRNTRGAALEDLTRPSQAWREGP